MNSIKSVQFGDSIQQIALTIIAKEGDKLIPAGTGFTISPDGLMMTAKHVIDALFPPQTLQNAMQTIDHRELYALYIQSETEGRLWPIDKVWFRADGIDIAFMMLRGAYDNVKKQNYKHKVVSLNLLPPPIGTRIMAFGYYEMSGHIEFTATKSSIIHIKQNTGSSTGQVVEIFKHGRDRSMLPFPCFQVDCFFNPGMSGGPVFRADTGNVCGVVCSSILGQPISFVSTIWPSMGINIQVALDEKGVKDYLVLDIAKKGFIGTDESLQKIKYNILPNNDIQIEMED